MKLIRKILSLSASALFVLILSGFLSLRPIAEPPARAQSSLAPANCNDVTGTTTAVLSPQREGRQSGIADSGEMDFNALSSQYQACAKMETSMLTPPTPAATGNTIQGWAWNTNLGYVSFYCDDGQNLGASCGNSGADSIDYQSIVLTGSNPDSRDVRGFAWNDNIGWISMGCSGGGAGGQNLGVSCGGTAYGVSIASRDGVEGTGCSGSGPSGAIRRGDLFGYAWNNSVGWINFCGAHANLQSITADVSYGASPSSTATPPATLPATPPATPLSATATATAYPVYANNSDYHEIQVAVFENGAPIGNGSERTIVIGLTWNDNLKTDQVTRCNLSDLPCHAMREDNWEWDPTNDRFYKRIYSVAPTNAENSLVLTAVQVQIRNDATRDLSPAIPVSFPSDPLPRTFNFAAPVTVSAILSPDSTDPPGTITTTSNASSRVQVQVTKPDNSFTGTEITLNDELYDCATDDYEFQFDRNGDGIITDDTITPSSPTFPETPDVCSGGTISDINSASIASLSATPFTKTEYIYTRAEAAVADFNTTNLVSLQTIIGYSLGGKDVRYYSLKSSGGVPNQAADVRGNVRLDVARVENLPSGGISQSLGGSGQSKREQFYRAIKNLVRGASAWKNSDPGRTTLNASSNLGRGNINPNTYYFNKTNLETPRGQPCSIRLRDAGNINFSHPATIIADGCNIFIDQNIISTGRVGIIALEDLNSALPSGNIYICHAVTDIQANIVADGSMFSYGDGSEDCRGEDKRGMFDPTNGTPVYSSGINVRNLLKNQLTITGSLTSNNTYSGSTANPLVMCDGGSGDASNPRDVNIARSCDINFLRYAKTIADSESISPTGLCWAADVLKSRTLPNYNNCSFNFPGLGETGGRSIINIIYREPSRDLPVFNAVR